MVKCDGLQKHGSTLRDRPACALDVVVVVIHADCLEHLAADCFVELPANSGGP